MNNRTAGLVQPSRSGGVMNHIVCLFACLVFIIPASFAQAEFYQYVDDDGVRHFTENYADIPEKYKPLVNIHKSEPAPETADDTDTDRTQKEETPATLESLMMQKNELDAEYESLVERQSRLISQKQTLVPEEYSEVAEQLNADIRSYRQRQEAYNERVKTYNSTLPQADN